MEDGVWRTVGGRRIFIKKGQSLQSAMKDSGKFGSSKKKKVDPNDLEELKKIADSGENIDNYEGLDDIAKDYIKNRRKETSNEEFTKKANEIHEKSLEKAKESEKTTDEDKRYNTKQEREAEFGKNVDEMYNRFHGKTDKEIAEEIAKERGEKLLTDEEQKQREIEFMKNLEKEADNEKQTKRLGRGIKDLDQDVEEKIKSIDETSKKASTDDGVQRRERATEMYLNGDIDKSELINDYFGGNRDGAEEYIRDLKEESTQKRKALGKSFEEIQEDNKITKETKGLNDLFETGTNETDAKREKIRNQIRESEKNRATYEKNKSKARRESDAQIEKDFPDVVPVATKEEARITNTIGYDDIDDVVPDFAEKNGITYAEAKYTLLKDEFEQKQGTFIDFKEDKYKYNLSDSQIKEKEDEAKAVYFRLQEAQEQLESFEKENQKQSYDWVKKAFAQYKKNHPRTKLTISDFKKQQK